MKFSPFHLARLPALCFTIACGSVAFAHHEEGISHEVAPAVVEEVVQTDTVASPSFVRDAAPEATPVSVVQLREQGYAPGQQVTMRAQIGGRKMPWLNGVALMVLVDAGSLAACTTGTCGIPWGFCSAPPDKLHQHTSVVRWLDNDGKPHRVSFHQIADIAPLSTVIITGTIADVGDPRALVIDADSMFLEDRGPFAAMMDKMKEAGTDPYAMSPKPQS